MDSLSEHEIQVSIMELEYAQAVYVEVHNGGLFTLRINSLGFEYQENYSREHC